MQEKISESKSICSKIALEFDVTITSTSIRSGGGGPDQDPKIEDWIETKGPTYDLDF
jgi:hypothetical protein